MPYYVRPTLWNRYGPSAWGPRLMGLPLPGDGMPEEYRIDELGPDAMKGRGKEWASECVDRLKVSRKGGCIFGGGGEGLGRKGE